MKITDLAIKYRTAILVLTLLLVGGGAFSYVTLPKESNPSIEIPTIVVTTIYPGASPSDVESIVTQEIENELQGISGIDEIRSTSTQGVSTVVVEFTPSVPMDAANQDVREQVDVAQANLPDNVEDPIVSEISTDEFPIMRVNLAASYSLARLKEVAEDLQDEVEGIAGVLEADLVGGLEREVQIDVDLSALKGYGLTFSDLTRAIQTENTNIPGGDIDVDRQSYLVRVDGQIKNPEIISDLVIAAPNGTPVYVRDVADVTFGFKERESYARLKTLKEENDEGAVVEVAAEQSQLQQVISLSIKKRAGQNIIETVDAVKAAIEGFDFPSGTQVSITGDQSEQVRTLVSDLENNIIAGLLFVVLVLLFFMGVRNATLVGIAIPLSMLTSFLVFQILGYTLNFIILFSLIIALGMLVDNAVVIVENIYRFREEGYSRWEAAKLGTAEVGGAVVASTATTVSVFAPLMFWPGLIGEFMSYLPLTLIVTLSASLFVALIINPVVTGQFVKLDDEESASLPRAIKLGAAVAMVGLAVMLGISNWKTLVVVVLGVPLLWALYVYVLKPVGDGFVQQGLPKLVGWYRGFLEWMLTRDYSGKRALLRNVGALGALVGGLLILIVGGLCTLIFGQTAAMIALVPGGLLVALGVLGILLHTLESVYLGGWVSVKAGLIFGALLGAALVLALVTGNLTVGQLLILLAPVAVLVGVGLAGAVLNRRERLLLTDNRAALLNGSMGLLFIIVGMYALAPTGVAFFPSTDPDQIQIALDAPVGTNIEASNRIAETATERIQTLIDENPAVEANIKNLSVNVGVGGDAAFGGGAQRASRSQISLNLVDFADRAEPSTVTLQKLRDQLQGIPGVDIEFAQNQTGPSTGPPVNIEISGPEPERTRAIAREVKRMLTDAAESGRIPGLVDVADDLDAGRPEVSVEVDRQKAAQFGLSTQQVASTVRAAINGTEAGEYRDGNDDYDITVRLQKSDRQSLESLRNLTIETNDGAQIPLVSVADLREGSGLGSITRLDLERVVTVEGGTAPGFTGPEVLGRVQEVLADYRQELPPGYQIKYTGESEDQAESFGFLLTALLIGVALILMILIAQFNSISAPLIIMAAVALSLIGVMLGLIVTRTPFSLFTFIGIISLAGIVVNNNIVLVDYIMQLRQRGLEKQEAILEAGATRLRPVLLTAITTVLGLVPLTFGINIDFVGLLVDFDPNFQIGSSNTQFWGPMGTAIIAGLTFGTFLTLVIVPVMYSAFDSASLRFARFMGRGTTDAALVSDTAETNGEADVPGGDGATREAVTN